MLGESYSRSLLGKRPLQIVRKATDLLDLLIRSSLLEPARDKKTLTTAPHQRRESLLSHQSRRTDIAEVIAFAFNERYETIALQNEMGSNAGRDNLNTSGGKAIEPVAHILYRPRSSSFRLSSKRRSSSSRILSAPAFEDFEFLSTESST